MRTIALFLILHFPALCLADTIHVPGDYASIQAGIDAAVNGDIVLVASGTYVENINFGGKRITVRSELGPEQTVIDGGNPTDPDFGSVVTFRTGESMDSILQGFKLTNGTGNYLDMFGSYYHGGGVFFFGTQAVVKDNIITNNSVAGYGGGICCTGNARPTISNNVIAGNSAELLGGGIACATQFSANIAPKIENNVITQNSACNWGGGGVSFAFTGQGGQGYIKNNTITNNSTENGQGGGIYFSSPKSTMQIENNYIAENSAESSKGGGAYINGSMFTSNTLMSNYAVLGGGIYWCGETYDPKIFNNIIYANTAVEGGGICCGITYLHPADTMTILNNTVVGNSAQKGGGIYFSFGFEFVDVIKIENSILWGNNASLGSEIYLLWLGMPATLHMSHCTVDGGLRNIFIDNNWTLDWGSGMIISDPQFVDNEHQDYHLINYSPCIDAGDNTAVSEVYDFEGDPRIYQGTIDIGADEFHNHLYCTGDFTPSGSIEGKFIGLPGTTPVGLFIGSGVMDPPLQHGWGEFYLEAPWVLFPLIPIPSNGVLVIPATLPTTPAPYDIPMQALIGWELSNLFVLEVR